MLIIHAHLGKTEIIHNVDTTRYVATFGWEKKLPRRSSGMPRFLEEEKD